MGVKEVSGWIPGERVKSLHVVCEGSFMDAVIPVGDDDAATSQILQKLLTDAWQRPYMRAPWLKFDLHRTQIVMNS